jgi:hypothetical protein
VIEPLKIDNFPPRIAFHPLGIYYFHEKKELFVINHAFDRGGERIEVVFFHSIDRSSKLKKKDED